MTNAPRGNEQGFFSNAVAIELEACNDIALVVECRDKLLELCDRADRPVPISLETEACKRARLEQQLAEIHVTLSGEGWFEGINGTLYRSLEKLAHRTSCPEQQDKALLRRDDLELIARFLRTQKADLRTRWALQISKTVCERLGIPELANWSRFLLHREWNGAFYAGYRDHTVHSVYVLLLGWFFYTELGKVRKLVQEGDDSLRRPSVEDHFARNWTLTALAHDVGYSFETKEERIEKDALGHLRKFRRFFLESVVLYDEQHYLDFERSVYNEDRNDYIHDRLKVTENEVTEYEDCGNLIAKSDLFGEIDTDSADRVHLGGKGLGSVFKFLSETPPDGPRGGTRGAVADHGFTSGALLCAMLKLRRDWAGLIKSRGPYLIPCHEHGLSKESTLKRCASGPREISRRSRGLVKHC